MPGRGGGELHGPGQIHSQHEHRKHHQQGAELGQEDLARAHGQAGQCQAVAAAGKKRMPFERGKQGCNGHCQRDEAQLVGANFGENPRLATSPRPPSG